MDINTIIDNGAGVVAISIVFGIVITAIQKLSPILIDIKNAMALNVEVINNNTIVCKTVVEVLSRIELQMAENTKDVCYTKQSVDGISDRVIKTQQDVGIILDKLNNK